MSLTAALSETTLSASPGEEVALSVTVRNTGGVVDEFTLEVVGDAVDWAVIEPPTLSLFPDDDGQATVHFHVPRSVGVRSGELPFAVRVRSREDPEGVIVEEGVLLIGSFTDVVAELTPQSSRHWLVGRHEVAVENSGNMTLIARMRGVDPTGELGFAFDSPELAVEPGTAVFTGVKVRASRILFRGTPQTLPFQISVEIDGQDSIALDGAVVQTPLFGSVAIMALAAFLGLLLLFMFLWLAILKPKVRSTARASVAKPLSQTNAAVNEIGAKQGTSPTLPTDPKAISASAGAPSGSGGTNTGGAANTKPAVPAESGAARISTELGNPIDKRLLAAGNGTVSDAFRIDDGKVFSLTDLVFQNPAGDTGTVTLIRGKETLFLNALADFRNVDFHFVAPIVFDEKVDITLRVECANPGGKPCSVAAYLVGFVKNK